MSLWDRFKSSLGLGDEGNDKEEPAEADGDADAPRAAPSVEAKPAPPVDEAAPLRKAGAPDGPTADEAIAILRRLRGTQDETAALEAALSAANPPGAVRIACAEILAERGEDRRALDVLEGESSTDALLLTADLFASRGELPRAIGAIERVLARQIDAPGARERHARWVDALGIAKRPERHLDEPTMLNARSGQAPFRLLRQVARGGAGTVYEAEDDVLQRRIAYKVYHGEGADRAVVQREIRMIELFAGPGVARAFDASPDDGWVALEWIARGSIRDVIKAGNLDALVPIARWSAPLARALARVHAAGWVHADVKPANVLLRSLDDAVLTDFGIARRRGESSSGGSPGYLSPERLGGEPASPLDDVYGFGRVVEDVLQAVAKDPGARRFEPRFEFWEKIVRACLGPATHRPMDAAQLATLVGA